MKSLRRKIRNADDPRTLSESTIIYLEVVYAGKVPVDRGVLHPHKQ